MSSIQSPIATLLPATTGARTGQTAWGGGAAAGANPSANPLQQVQDRILKTLASRIPGATPEDLKKLDANEFTPEKVAERIGSFVALGLENARARGDSEEKIQSLYDSAVKGAEQGFREAREILKGLDILNGTVAEQVDETEKRTFDALAELSPRRQQEGAQELAGLTSVAVADRYQKSEGLDLTLKTREGDTVTIRFNHETDAQRSAATASDDAGNRVSRFDLSRSEKSGFAFSVEGDLNAEEIDALQKTIRDVSRLADEFFNGDVQKAFDQADKIDIDRSQLSSLDLRMTRGESYSASAAAARRYQETQQLGDGATTGAGRPGLRLGNLLNELRETADRPGLAFLDQPRAAVGQAMHGLVEQDGRFQNAAGGQQQVFSDHLKQLLAALYGPDGTGGAADPTDPTDPTATPRQEESADQVPDAAPTETANAD